MRPVIAYLIHHPVRLNDEGQQVCGPSIDIFSVFFSHVTCHLIGDRRESMVLFLLIPFLFLTAISAHSADTLKQQASAAIKKFLQVTEPIAEFQGRYVDTPPEYGETCRVRMDFSESGQEYFTITGEYTPSTSIGEGMHFDAPDDTFVMVISEDDTLILEQRLRDSVSTGTRTSMRLHKQPEIITVTIRETSRLLFFSSTQVKHCVIPLE
jgi:hypothetical protein